MLPPVAEDTLQIAQSVEVGRRIEPFDPDSAAARLMLAAGRGLRAYHRHRVAGLGHLRRALRRSPAVILIGNHSLAMVDGLMFATEVHDRLGRNLRFMAHEMAFFRLGPLRRIANGLGLIPSRHPELADELLRRRELLMLYPGAGAEAALRSYRREPYVLKWYQRTGFVELALRHRATILFVAGLGIDEMFHQSDLAIPGALFRLVDGTYLDSYRGLRLQFGAAGLEIVPGFFPLPVQASHVISPPLPLDPDVDPGDRRAVEDAQVRLWAHCQRFLDEVVAKRERRSDVIDRMLRRGMGWLRAAGL